MEHACQHDTATIKGYLNRSPLTKNNGERSDQAFEQTVPSVCGILDGAVCTIVGHDSEDSTLRMRMPIGVEMDVETVGGSEYKGDMYIDLKTRWLRKVTIFASSS